MFINFDIIVYYKYKRNETNLTPDYYIHKSDDWVVFPHELDGLTKDEIKQKNEGVYKVLFEEEKEKK